MSESMISEQADAVASKYGIDLIKVQFKATMMGMILGVVYPGAIVAVAYFINSNRTPPISPADIDMFFWILVAIGVIQVLIAFYFRRNLLSKPCVKTESTFAVDFQDSIKKTNIILASFHNSIAIYGLVLFFMGAEIDVALLFAVLSVIAFQILRFRGPLIEKAIVSQQEHVSAGRFWKSGGLFG